MLDINITIIIAKVATKFRLKLAFAAGIYIKTVHSFSVVFVTLPAVVSPDPVRHICHHAASIRRNCFVIRARGLPCLSAAQIKGRRGSSFPAGRSSLLCNVSALPTVK